MKILITGGCGFVGSNIAIFLKKKLKRSNIFSVDNLFRKGSKINQIRLKKHRSLPEELVESFVLTNNGLE